MEFTLSLELDTVQLKPKLDKYESIIAVESDIGIYDKDEKSANHQSGRVYITQYNLFFVHSQYPELNSFKLPLNWIDRIVESRGFITTSPKLTLHIDGQKSERFKLGFKTSSSHGTFDESAIVDWECAICQTKNFNRSHCELCGVANQVKESSQGTICSQCTFLNHRELKFCEICEAPLTSNSTSSTIVSTTRSLSSNGDRSSYIKLSFRKGGIGAILAALNKSLSQRRWESRDSDAESTTPTTPSSASRSTNFGIDGILKQRELKNTQISSNLTTAFKDLDHLMSKATEMIELAQSISQKLHTPNPSNKMDSEQLQLNQIMAMMGIESPVTQATSGDRFYEELSRELSGFLTQFIDHKPYNGIIDLVEVYCLFNKARTVNMISPNDLLIACNQFQAIHASLKLTQFSNGVTIIQSSQFSLENLTKLILDRIELEGPQMARDLAINLNMSLQCAEEFVKLVENEGSICRDESIEGIKFYKNEILKFNY